MDVQQIWLIIIANAVIGLSFYTDFFGFYKREDKYILSKPIVHENVCMESLKPFKFDDKTTDYVKLKSLRTFVENCDFEEHAKRKIIKCIKEEIDYLEWKIKNDLGEEEMKKMGLLKE